MNFRGEEAMRRGTTLLAAIVLVGAGLSTTACSTTAADAKAAKANTAAAADRAAGASAPGTAGTADTASTAAKSGTSAASCAVTWGSTAKTAPDTDYRPLVNIRTGRHDCYDRMVFDLDPSSSGGPTGYRAEYVPAFHQDGSGEPIPVSGGAILEISVAAPSYDPQTGNPTYGGTGGDPLPGVNLTGYKTFRDARFGASFEGRTQIGLGVRARLPFRVFQSGDRLVVDVAHSWAASV